MMFWYVRWTLVVLVDMSPVTAYLLTVLWVVIGVLGLAILGYILYIRVQQGEAEKQDVPHESSSLSASAFKRQQTAETKILGIRDYHQRHIEDMKRAQRDARSTSAQEKRKDRTL